VAKKVFLILVLVVLITSGVFALDHKHEGFDMLLGIGWGLDVGAHKDYADDVSVQLDTNFGVNYDFYIFPWLSASTALLFGPSVAFSMGGDSFSLNGGMYLTIPFSGHINIPFVEWLYLGAGVGLNIPLSDLNVTSDDGSVSATIKAKYFTSLPIDIGFDFAKKEKRAGGRLLFRIIPNIHPEYTWDSSALVWKEDGKKVIMTYGIFWQFYNWKIHGK
jgi:hypothetical protein